MSNLPITTVIPVSTTVLPTANTVPTAEHGNQEGDKNNNNHGKSGVPSTTSTVVTVPTTIHTIMNGVSAQILTVVPVTSSLTVDDHPGSAPKASFIADADSHAGNAQPPSPESGNNLGAGKESLPPTHTPSTTAQPTEPSKSGLTSKPMIPATNNPIAVSTSSRPPVVTAAAPGLVGSDGMRVAFLVFAVAALL